ncbi:MAG: NDP-sugar synthase [Terriglobales bacterium]
MKAMILAAGLGTRLRPLTDNRPKALVEIAGRTLLEITLARLRGFGVHEVIINVHHLADMVVEYLKANNNFGMRIEISREDVLLDTGGGLKKTAYFFLDSPEEPFLLHNVDVISTIDFHRMLQYHKERKPLATLAVQNRYTSRHLLFNPQLELCGRRFTEDRRTELVRFSGQVQALGFCGIHIISPRLFARMTEEGVFSIISAYLGLVSSGERIVGFRADEYAWRDIGSVEKLTRAAQEYAQSSELSARS